MLNLHTSHPLKPLNTMGIDGTADTLVEWSDAADLHRLFTDPELSTAVSKSFKAIGGGSNLLFTSYRVHTPLLRCVNEAIVVDNEINSHSYIVPGLGDAGDLAYGIKE